MFELAMAHINQVERERRIAAGLRRHEILRAPDDIDATGPTRAQSVPVSRPRTTGPRVRIAQR